MHDSADAASAADSQGTAARRGGTVSGQPAGGNSTAASRSRATGRPLITSKRAAPGQAATAGTRSTTTQGITAARGGHHNGQSGAVSSANVGPSQPKPQRGQHTVPAAGSGSTTSNAASARSQSARNSLASYQQRRAYACGASASASARQALPSLQEHHDHQAGSQESSRLRMSATGALASNGLPRRPHTASAYAGMAEQQLSEQRSLQVCCCLPCCGQQSC